MKWRMGVSGAKLRLQARGRDQQMEESTSGCSRLTSSLTMDRHSLK